MNNEGLQKLQEIGTKKIYTDTHIPTEHIQAIMHESFDGLTKIHFVGFVSILEREYDVDLSELKEKGVAYYDELYPIENTTKDGIFLAPKKQKNFTLFYIVFAMLVSFIAFYYTLGYANKSVNISQKHIDNATISNTTINNTKQNISSFENNDTNLTQKEQNTTIEENATTIKTASVVKEDKAAANSLKIIPQSRVWMGYIELKTNKKYQKILTKEFVLDPNKAWLLVFGHGHIDIVVNGEKKKFHSKKTLRLLYKDATLKELDFNEFKQLNRGNAW